MHLKESVDMLQKLVIDNGLPKTDLALFGVKCLYCGKSDRIRQLESPDELQGKINPPDYKTYTELWEHLAISGSSLGICKFCQNILRLYVEMGEAKALYE